MKTEEKLQVVDLLFRHRVQDYKKIGEALKKIARLRKKAPAGWHSAEVIRKFRESR